jgi:hypothetical protein
MRTIQPAISRDRGIACAGMRLGDAPDRAPNPDPEPERDPDEDDDIPETPPTEPPPIPIEDPRAPTLPPGPYVV